MKTLKSVTILLLIVCMCLPTYALSLNSWHIFPIGFSFAEGSDGTYHHEVITEGITFDSALPASEVVYHDSIEDFTSEVRAQMVARNSTIKVGFVSDVTIDGTFYDKVYDGLFEHTGVSTEGDYLWFHFGGYNASSSARAANGKYYYDFTYTVKYTTTAEQEQAVTEAIAPIVKDILAKCSTDYEKICVIYKYITDHVTYDLTNLADPNYKLKYSAYAALINGTSVCQGYTNLIYRLLLECGVDCRTVSGIGNNGAHGWNIVKLDGLYYFLDSTWDSQYAEADLPFAYFLLGSSNMKDHTLGENYTTEKFTSAYPISPTDYTSKHAYSNQWTIDRYATDSCSGVKSHHCEKCDFRTDITTLPYLNASSAFNNFKNKGWSIDGINFVYSNGFMGDTGNGDFEQTGQMTRSMFVTVLWRIAGCPTPTADASSIFKDINPKQKWYHSAVAWAYENGIVTGTSADTFSPNGDVTREQIATFLYRFAANYLKIDVSVENDITVFPDNGNVGKYAYHSLAWANAAGLIKGQTSGNASVLAPKKNATREEVAVVVRRFCLEG